MTKSTITRERLEKIKSWRETYGAGSNVMLPAEEAEALARIALDAMDSEPNCKERKLFCSTDTARMRKVISASAGTEATPLYRHAQQPVVPDDVLDALQKVARIRLNLNDFDGDRRGIADCLCDAEEALIEVVNRRAAMLATSPQLPGSEPATVPGKWIPVSERMPIEFEAVIAFDGDQVYGEAMYSSDDGFTSDGYEPCDRVQLQNVTHWMPIPEAPQEVK
ncbi:TPA: DUF551 domain-containing protein [Klebsiella pneumoniae]